MSQVSRRLWLLRAFLLFTLLLTLGAVQQFAQQTTEELEVITRTRILTQSGMYGLASVLGLVSLLTWTSLKDRLFTWVDASFLFLQKLKWILPVLALALMVGFAWLARGYYGRYLVRPLPRYLVFWLMAVGLAMLLFALAALAQLDVYVGSLLCAAGLHVLSLRLCGCGQ